MRVEAIKTHPILINESLVDIMDRYVKDLDENCIVAITSKIVSICQGRVISKEGVDKVKLIKNEADAYIQDDPMPYGFPLTIKYNQLIPSSGIDESNCGHCYVLYPLNPQKVACDIWKHLRHKFGVKNLGIIITDSTTSPLKRGVTGVSIGWCGFKPLYSYVGKTDIFNRPIQFTQKNNLDAIACASVFVMGEGDEQTPLALLSNMDSIEYSQHPPTKDEYKNLQIPIEEDIYGVILQKVRWIRNK